MNILPDNISGCLFGEFKSKVMIVKTIGRSIDS